MGGGTGSYDVGGDRDLFCGGFCGKKLTEPASKKANAIARIGASSIFFLNRLITSNLTGCLLFKNRLSVI